jgi:cytochrome c
MRRVFGFCVVLGMAWFLFGCTTPVTPPATQASPDGTAAAVTAGNLAEIGHGVFRLSCACHGQDGTGVPAPTLVGANAKLGKFGTAQGLLEYFSTNMPVNRPGALTPDEYFQILNWLLVQNNTVSSSTVLDSGTLDSITLK